MDNLNSIFFPLLYSAIGILFLRGVYKTFMVKPDTALLKEGQNTLQQNICQYCCRIL